MAAADEEKYKELLNPIKDPEKSFGVNIAELLESYLQKFVQGEIPPNFNSAALLLQGCSSIYGKKVEYLYQLACTLHETVTKNKNDTDTSKKKDPRERVARQSKLVDPFCSIEIKPGKNLSCLRKKNISKSAAAAAVKKAKQTKSGEKKHAFVPVDLLPLEGEEKGDVFYDTRGEPVGNRNDFTLNKCRITQSGWLLMPTVSSDLLSPSLSDEQDTPESVEDYCDAGQDVDMESHDADEGYPPSSGCPSTAPPSQEIPSSQQSDEGLGSSVMGTPSEAAASQPEPQNDTPTVENGGGDVDTENIPMEEDFTAANKPRRSMRNALKPLQEEADRNNGLKEDLFAVRRPIEKNNTICYPPGMRSKKSNAQTLHPASVYCARTFFSVDTKLQKNDFFSLNVKAFANNSKFLNQIKKYKETIKAAKNKKKINGGVVPTDEDEEVDIEDLQEAVSDEHSFAVNPNLSNDDFAVDNEPLPELMDENPIADEIPLEDIGGDAPGADDMDAGAAEGGPEPDEDEEYEREQMAMFRDELQSVEQTEQMGERVREWQKRLRPFLETISQREKFDINLYGSRILESFDDNNRRQTKLFREFCRGKEKWEIHRYFMALLPLVNVGNVSVANEPRENSEEGEEDIAITLLSRRMHHLDLEQFGHGAGEH